jgi:aspartyl-tRNA(Asn)/glutamyl-tRNA(Gln) amidotransferase subunit A
VSAGALGRPWQTEPSAAEHAVAVRTGRVRPEAGVDAALDAARGADARRLNALVARHLSVRDAFTAAERAGGDVGRRRRAARGADGGVLAGVPVVLSDDLADLALPTTSGSRVLAGYVSPYEATAVARLLDAGALVLGKANMDEFGIGRTMADSAYGPTLHPADPTRSPGGACGGSAAAVAAGIVRMALGSDANGGVRRPAALCGVVGIKPTFGRVSRSGLATHAASLAQVGVFGVTVDDAALALEVVSGRDPRDSTTADIAVGTLRAGGNARRGRPAAPGRTDRPPARARWR